MIIPNTNVQQENIKKFTIDIYKIEVWVKQGMSHKQIQDFLWELAKETGLDFYRG